MPLPENFNSVEHFQDTLRKLHNRQVREEFSDVGGDDWDEDITTPRASLRAACTMQDNDTLDVCIFKYMFFHITIRRGEEFQEPVYGLPVGTYHESKKFKPQIVLYFLEDRGDVEDGYRRVDGIIRVRVHGEDNNSLTTAKLTILANKIKTEFCQGNGYRWHKGKVFCCYKDADRRYQLQLLCYSESEAKELIEKVLDIQDDIPDWKFLNVSKNEEPSQAFPTIPPNQIILNKSVKKPRSRPTAYVRFQYAYCSIWGLPRPIHLVDRTYRFADPLVSI